ncbi:hypothetical protein RN001_000506 [Aquatica leii]|uniref:Uncharacterized protein n=1 Tax=Aquatica leii TaxID=1421715 RepID=A0AAN7SSG5_9COLE|nr:hypothetical protein RN001_000506 [Aquatica leii]
MTLKSLPIDIYFHMTNHYRKLQNVKSVIDTSSPKGYGKSQCGRRSRPHSRIQSSSSAKSKISNSSDSKLDQNTNSSSARSHSLTVKPNTRRKSYATEVVVSCHLGARRRNRDREDQENKNYVYFLSSHKKEGSDNLLVNHFFDFRTVEHDYLKFSLRIMEDIIRNNIHTNEQMRNIFKNHLEANSGHLNNDKMIQQINYLQLKLNMFSDSDDENECSKVIPPVKYTQCSSSSILSPDLKCECKVVRRLPLVNEDVHIINNIEKSQSSKSFNIEQLLQEENEILFTIPLLNEIVENEFSVLHQSLSPCLSSVIEKPEPTSSNDDFKDINKSSACNNNNKSNDIFDDVKVMIATQSETNTFEDTLVEKEICSVLKNIENETGTPNNSVLLKPSWNETEQSSNGHHLTNHDSIKSNGLNIDNTCCDDKALVFTKSENIHMHCTGSINDNYVLISGPIFIPKAYLTGLSTDENISISTPNVSDKDRLLLVTKDASVNTDLEQQVLKKQESVSVQCIEPLVNTTDKCLNTSITGISFFESSDEPILKKASGNNTSLTDTIQGVDLDCYDLTPERDDNYKHMNAELLLGNEYEIQQDYRVFDVSPQLLKEFYPDESTQTGLSDWSLISKEWVQENILSEEPNSSLKVILPSHTFISIGSSTFSKFSKDDELDEISDDASNVTCQSLSKENTRRKSNLKHYSNPSVDSLIIEEDDIEDKLKKRPSAKGVSINIEPIKNESTDSATSDVVPDEAKTTDNSTVLQTISQHSSEEEEEHEDVDETKILNPLDILTPLPELVPQPSVLMTVKRVTKTWDRLRSKRSNDKPIENTRTCSFIDDMIYNANTLLDFNTNHESKKEKNGKNIELLQSPDKSLSHCCGLKKKNKSRELSTAEINEQIIPIISTVVNVDYKSEDDNSMLNQPLSTSNSSLQKGVHYKSQPVFIDNEEKDDTDDNNSVFMNEFR